MIQASSPVPAARRSIAHEAALFLGLGLLSYSLGAGIAALCREIFGLQEEFAVAISLAVLILVNFWLNRLIVFRATGRASHEFIKFLAASLTMRGFEYAVFLSLLHLTKLHYLAAYTVALLISNTLKFAIFRLFVFGGSPKTAG